MDTSQFCSDLTAFCESNQIPKFVVTAGRRKTLDWLFGLEDLSVSSVYAEWEHTPDEKMELKASVWTQDIGAVASLVLPNSMRGVCSQATRRKLMIRYSYTNHRDNYKYTIYNKACTFFWK